MSDSRRAALAKPWLSAYPPDVPAEVNVEAYSSLVEIFDESIEKYAGRPAYTNFDTTWTFSDLERLSRYFAAYLQSQNLGKGARIAIMLPNIFPYPVALFGALRAGMVAVNINPLYTARELRHILEDARPDVILVLENFAHVLQEAGEGSIRRVLTVSLGDLQPFLKGAAMNFVVRHIKRKVPAFKLRNETRFRTAMARGRSLDFRSVALTLGDLAFLQYTGGTTGHPMGAMLSHGNIVANLVQVRAWFKGTLREGEETIVTALPLYHVFALLANALLFLALGGRNLLITNPRDFSGFVNTLRKWPFTCMTGVNTLFNALLNTRDFDTLDFSRLRMVLGGGMAVQRAVAERWKKVTKTTLVEAYGLTETSPAACINSLRLNDYNGSIGVPIPSTECAIMNEQNEILPAGEAGEICIRGPQVMRGYWEREEETARAISKDGWFHSGDIGKMDENGYFYIVDRKKDMILVSGFNVYPNELEDVAAEHPGVREAAAVGIPHEKSGEVPILVVVRKDPALTEDELMKHMRAELTGYKCPDRIVFCDELPKSNVGKVLRRELRKMLAEE